jgi:hypothetical protein
MKPIKFITTFSEIGYNLYGKTWIQTFTDNVNVDNVSANIYVDSPIQVSNQKIKTIDYNTAIPAHKSWCAQFDSRYSNGNGIYAKKMGVRFSYKSFVMINALENNKDCYVIWLDGDCIFKQNQDFSTFPESLLNGKAIASQREHNAGNDHMESGVVIFDVDHEDCKKFLNKFKENYMIDNIIHMGSPFDGFIICKSIDQSGIDYIDLNAGYGRGGIQSDPNETFLHPEISKRFHHNIGITGKQQYSSWSTVSKQDQYFRLIQNSAPKKTPAEIKVIRDALLAKRKNVK